MNAGTSDASTSTDDIEGRPLCLFYFTHPFGVLSPEPPTALSMPFAAPPPPAPRAPSSPCLAPAPAPPPAVPLLIRTFIDMRPVSPLSLATWPPVPAPVPTTTPGVPPVAVTRPSAFSLGLVSTGDSPSTTVWGTNSSERGPDSTAGSSAHKTLIHGRTLPPLRPPTPKDSSSLDLYEDLWSIKRSNLERFFLPPIELPKFSLVERERWSGSSRSRQEALALMGSARSGACTTGGSSAGSGTDGSAMAAAAAAGAARALPRRLGARGRGVRKCGRPMLLTRLLKRFLAISSSIGAGVTREPCTGLTPPVRSAWPERRDTAACRSRRRGPRRRRATSLVPAPLLLTGPCSITISDVSTQPEGKKDDSAVSEPEPGEEVSRLVPPPRDAPMPPPPPRRAPAAAPPAPAPAPPTAGDASPGLLRRRYSVPEVVMRKYRLNRDRSGSSGYMGDSSPLCVKGACATVSPRELVRRGALLRRLRGHASPAAASATPPGAAFCRLCDDTQLLLCGRASRSLDGSRSELRPPSCRAEPPTSFATRHSGGWHRTVDSDLYSNHSNHPSTDSENDKSLESPTSSQLKCEITDLISEESRRMSSNEADRVDYGWSSKKYSSTLACGSSTKCNLDNATQWQHLTASASSCKVLEIIVSESLRITERNSESPAQTRSAASTAVAHSSNFHVDLDEYVSDILVESLNSLTDRLENVTASINGDRKISIVEKEIKVKLQNTGVNTVVHLSPTSNNQIIFGNAELYDCENNERVVTPKGVAVDNLQENDIQAAPESNAALLRIKQLFEEDPENNVKINDEVTAMSSENKNSGSKDARPLSVSMEVNASSDDAASPCASLVDSLDEPESPRTSSRRLPPPPWPASRCRAPLVRSAVAVLDLPPTSNDVITRLTVPNISPVAERSESFFVPIKDEDIDNINPNVIVADRMPEKIKQRLSRRHRRREMRQERVRRFRRNDREDIRHECLGILDALIDNVVMKIAREEYRNLCVRKRNVNTKANKKHSRETHSMCKIDLDDQQLRTNRGQHIRPNGEELHMQLEDSDPRRFYRKSEIREGGECIEILEILEYMTAPTSRGCSEIASDESTNGARARRSRIPVPVHEPAAARRPAPRHGPDEIRSERVFEVIPEERVTRGSSPVRRCSPSETVEADLVAAVSGSQVAPRDKGCTSTATSPLRPSDGGGGGVALRNAATMTSPSRAALKAKTRSRTRLDESLSSQGATEDGVPRARGAARAQRSVGAQAEIGAEASRKAGASKLQNRRIEKSRRRRDSTRTLEPELPYFSRSTVRASSRGPVRARPGGSSSSSAGARASPPPPPPPPPPARRSRPALPRHHPGKNAGGERHKRVAGDEEGEESEGADGGGGGGWSVTVAGSGRAAAPADIEMRLRFGPSHPRPHPHPTRTQCAGCCRCAHAPVALAPPASRSSRVVRRTRHAIALDDAAAGDSSSWSARKSSPTLPALAATCSTIKRRADVGRSKARHSAGRGRTPHGARLGDGGAAAPSTALRGGGGGGGLAVLGRAIRPHRKPRAPTCTERDCAPGAARARRCRARP